MFKLTALLFVAIAMVAAAPEPKATPEAKPGVIAYSSPYVSAPLLSSALVERSYHGNLAYAAGYPYSAPLVAAPVAYSPYSAYSSPYAYSAYSAPLLYK
ncbi:unnamed protein product [Diamesa hyperborea]